MSKNYCFSPAARFAAMLVLVFLGTLSSWAAAIGEGEALQRAVAFMQQRGRIIDMPSSVRRASSLAAGSSATATEAYYVFNIQDEGGFVVVSGDDRAPAILGYADSGSFNADDIPDGLRYLLGQYADEMAWLDAHPEYVEQDVAASRFAAARQPVAPLLQSQWNQGTPYNNRCPTITTTVDDEEVIEKTVTGCVATSMAQVLYYHQWPQQPTATIPGYTTSKKQIEMPALDPIPFDWESMTDTYTSSDAGASADAVAQLMLYCGQSVRMNYNVSSSSANSGAPVGMLKAYFGYDADYVQRKHYTYQQWVDLVYEEMASQRPVILCGQSADGAHSFVCDGYDSGDYFHINWGWGGSSDGYYRLSLLNPYEQGIGGSSTLDGFSYSQDAVIGITPRSDGTTAQQRLFLDVLQFDSTGSTATKTITRDNAEEAFSIPLYYMVYSYLFDTNTFDVAVQMVDANGNVVGTLSSTSNEELTFGKGVGTTFDGVTPTGLADGTYYIKVVGRQQDATELQDCYDAAQLQIEAVVSGNELTLSAPFVSGSECKPKSATINVNDKENAKVGYELEVIASVTGGSTDYHGSLLLYVGDVLKMGKAVDIPAGQTVDVRFSYTPDEAGQYVITVRTAKNVTIGTGETVTIGESDATTDIDLGFDATITNLNASGKLYGNAFRATVTVTNSSETNSYAGQLNCSVREWTKTDNGDDTYTWKWSSIGVTVYPLVVEKEGTTTVDVAGDGLQPGKLYSVRLSYKRKTDAGTVADALMLGVDADGVGSLEVAENGYMLGDANGNITPCDGTSGINAGDACYADLRNISSFDGLNITLSTNPNCLYLLADGVDAPAALLDANVVIGSSAATIALADEYPFYSPIAFTAEEISYTRTFTLAAGGNKGWNTIVLPFAPTSIKVDDAEKAWFHSDTDEDGHFWLRTFTGDASGKVYFGYPTAMEAYTPYLIAVPGDTWGDEWQLTGKPMVFSGTSASIVATKDVGTPASGNYFMFCGSTAGITVGDAIYALNDAGSKFVKQTTGTVAPFRGWFEAISISSLTVASLSIGSVATDIRLPQVNMLPQQQTVYDLQGRSVQGYMKPGIYIMGGKKVIIK